MSKSPRYLQYPEPLITIPGYKRYYSKNYENYENYDIYDSDDNCEVCEKNYPRYNCNTCAKSICGEDKCCITFPHYHNTTYFVCTSCTDAISLKLILQIDLGKLILLKEKIRTGTTCNSVCSSRTTSRGSCSTNTNSIGTLSNDWGASLYNSDDGWVSPLSNSDEHSNSSTISNDSDLCT